jgi:hypothetical protein
LSIIPSGKGDAALSTGVQFGLRAILPHSNTPARNASRSDAGGPSLRAAGFEDEDDDEDDDEYEAPCEILGSTDRA